MTLLEEYAQITLEIKILTARIQQIEPELIKQRNEFAKGNKEILEKINNKKEEKR